MAVAPRQVVLLAAGMGTRLGALGGGMPKALFDAAGRTLLDRALDHAGRFGPAERIVVGGYDFDRVATHLHAVGHRDVRLVENASYRDGNLRTLEAALPHVIGPFLLMNVDHVYPEAVAARQRAEPGEAITAFVDFDRALGDDDMKVALDANRHVRRISKQLTHWHCGYVGMTYVPARRLERYRAAVADVRARLGVQANVEHVIQGLADAGEPVLIGDISGIGWCEIDTPEDVRSAFSRRFLGSVTTGT